MSALTRALAKVLFLPVALALPLTACASEVTAPPAAVTSVVAQQGSEVTSVAKELATKKYKMSTVRKHNTRASCWTVVGTGVYNLTKWINKHPGGAKRILAMCGRNATKAFRAQHGSTGKAARILATYKIGKLA